LGFFGLSLFLWDLFDWSGSSDLLGGFFVFISVELILDVANVSFSSTLFSWSVVSAGSASSVKGMALLDSLDWSTLSVMSDFLGVVSDSGWDFSIDYLIAGLGGFLGACLLQLSSLLVG
jgi:hypothetical protein